MSNTMTTAIGAEVRDFPHGLNPNLTVGELIDGYLVEYPKMKKNRDTSRHQRLGFWRAELGNVPVRAMSRSVLNESVVAALG